MYAAQGLKSRGEARIAGLLDRNRIGYQYEYPLAVVDCGKTKIWYPDFRLPEFGMIIEYFGMNGDVGYDNRTVHKVKAYRQAGIEGVFVRSNDLEDGWERKILDEIEGILRGRLQRFYGKVNQDRR